MIFNQIAPSNIGLVTDFGYMDGIGQPHIDGFGDGQPGQTTVPLGIIIAGEDGDNTFRPHWMTGGSFLAFRKLKQLVPEFNSFLWNNAIEMPGMTQQQGADLLGARMFGRWRSVRNLHIHCPSFYVSLILLYSID